MSCFLALKSCSPPFSFGRRKATFRRFQAAVLVETDNAVKAREASLAYVGPETFSKDSHAMLEPDDWRHTEEVDNITPAEVTLAKRCHGAHIETLSQDVTQVGSHYLLIHYDVPYIDASTFTLRVHGLVEKELCLSMANLRRRPSITTPVLMACAGIGRVLMKKRLWTHVPWGQEAFGCASWTGCSLAEVLMEAGIKDGATQVVFTGADKGVEGDEVQHYQRSLTLQDAMLGHVMLVYAMNGEDLVPCHGAPLRLIVPGWYGMASVKWLTSIEVRCDNWFGYQMKAYSFRRSENDPGMVPVTRLPVRALMSPPGCPDFFSRSRIVSPGSVRITGKAWSGPVDLERVEVSVDGGTTWKLAQLGQKNGPFGWASWHFDWEATQEGQAVLVCRAFDVRGRSQDPLGSETQFNWTGMGYTVPQHVYCRVDKRIDTVGAKIPMIVEHKAAKQNLNRQANGSGLPEALVEVLYRLGSQ